MTDLPTDDTDDTSDADAPAGEPTPEPAVETEAPDEPITATPETSLDDPTVATDDEPNSADEAGADEAATTDEAGADEAATTDDVDPGSGVQDDVDEPITEQPHGYREPHERGATRPRGSDAYGGAFAGAGHGVGPAAQEWPMRRLYRSRHDSKIGGVSAGIAEYLGIDPTIVRLATLLFAFTGIGFVAYLAAWVIVPLRPEGIPWTPRVDPVADERTLTIGFGVAALAVAIGIATGSWGVLAVALVAGGVWLLSERTVVGPRTEPRTYPLGPYPYGPPPGSNRNPYAVPARPPGPSPERPADPARFAPPEPGREQYGPMPYAATPRPAFTEGPPRPPVGDPNWNEDWSGGRRRRPQRITWLVLSVLLLLAAIGIAAAAGDWWDLGGAWYFGVALIVIAVGIVAGQIAGGGARGLIPLLLLTGLALVPVAAADGLIHEGIGEAYHQPDDIAELETRYAHGIGQLTVDLTELDPADIDERIEIELGIGDLTVIVPESLAGTADIEATAGEVRYDNGIRDQRIVEDGWKADSGTIVLEGEDGDVELEIDIRFGSAELKTEPG